jgi:DNA-binding transcriptional LysR family regulator
MNSIDGPAGQLSLHGRPFGVEIQQLLAFLAIYEERQVTLAARRLGRSQSALSHALSRLRELMRDELFVLRGGEMWPTTVAQQLYPTIRQAVALIDSLHEERRLFDPLHDTFELRIGMTDYAEKMFSPQIWMALEREAPGIRLTIRSIDRYSAESALLSDTVDLAIVGNPVLADAAIDCDELLMDPYVVAYATNAHAPEMDLARYLSAAHLRVAVGQGEFSAVDGALKVLGRRRDVRCIVPSFMRVPAMLACSNLVATLARGVFTGHAEAASTVSFQTPPFEIAPVRIALLSLNGSRASSAQRWVRELVRVAAGSRGSGNGQSVDINKQTAQPASP